MEGSQEGTGLFDRFPEQVREDVQGLLYLGYIEDTFEFCGHSFTLHTLNGEEELCVGPLCKEYSETLTQAKAWAWANIAVALGAVDHDPDFCPQIAPDPYLYAKAKFRYCLKWYWPTAEFLYNQYLSLVERQVEAIKAFRDLSPRDLESFSPSPDSLTAPGDSEEPQEDIRDYID